MKPLNREIRIVTPNHLSTVKVHLYVVGSSRKDVGIDSCSLLGLDCSLLGHCLVLTAC